MVLTCQVGPFHLMLTQINLEMNCVAKNKCPESQKLDTRSRGENLIATPTCVIYSIPWPTTVTAKANHSRQKQLAHGKSKLFTAKAIRSWQKQIHSQQKQMNSNKRYFYPAEYTNLVWSVFISFYSQFYSLPKEFWFRPLLMFSITAT